MVRPPPIPPPPAGDAELFSKTLGLEVSRTTFTTQWKQFRGIQ